MFVKMLFVQNHLCQRPDQHTIAKCPSQSQKICLYTLPSHQPYTIEPPPPFASGLRTDSIAGMARQHDKFLIVLAVEQVLSIAEMSQVAKAKTQEGVAS